jgi:hypothetical protein
VSVEADVGGGGGSGFTVDPTTLAATAQALSGLGGELTALGKAPSTSGTGLGGGSVESTVHEFFGKWNYELGKLDGNLKNVIANLKQAADNYSTSDACVAQGAQTK